MDIECMEGKCRSDEVKLPKIGFGTAELGEEAEDAVTAALYNGYTLIDTARAYGSEKAVGKAVSKICSEGKIKREDLIIQTKLSAAVTGYQQTLDDFERSLDTLQMSYVDVYLIHWPVIRGYEETYREKNIETWRAFEKLYQEKKVRMLGVCNFLERHLLDIFGCCSVPPVIQQIEIHPGYQQRGLAAFSKEHGMQIEAWSPMGRGVLNKPEFVKMAEKYNKNIGQLALRWSCEQGYIPLVRSKNEKHIESNMDIFDFTILQEDKQVLDALNTNDGYMDIWSYKRQQMY